jgi:hypothetical protein
MAAGGSTRTFSRFDRRFAREAGLLERPPFEILLVASAWHVPPCALLAGGLGLVALEALRFARYTACARPTTSATGRALDRTILVASSIPR